MAFSDNSIALSTLMLKETSAHWTTVNMKGMAVSTPRKGEIVHDALSLFHTCIPLSTLSSSIFPSPAFLLAFPP